MLRTGSEEWWQTLRGPQCRAVDDAIEVTFWWRDPAGDEDLLSPSSGMALYHRRDRPPSECATAIAATSPRDRRLVLAHYAVADLARQLLFYSLRP